MFEEQIEPLFFNDSLTLQDQGKILALLVSGMEVVYEDLEPDRSQQAMIERIAIIRTLTDHAEKRRLLPEGKSSEIYSYIRRPR